MRNRLSLLFSFFLSFSSVSFASGTITAESTFEDQLAVALKRQQAGVPFDAPLEIQEGWQDFFNQAVSRVRAVLEEDDQVEGARKTELYRMLDLVNTKGGDLFGVGEMDTHWYLFLHRLMGEVLSEVHNAQGAEERFFGISRFSFQSPKEFVELVEGFATEVFLRKEHLETVRSYLEAQFREATQEDGSVYLHNSPPLKWADAEYSFELCADSLVLNMDCFYLPHIGPSKEILFPIELMNAAMAHRICLGGIPTAITDFDSTKRAVASAFLNHDLLGHGILFSRLAEPVLHFDPVKDPYVSAVHPLWQAIDGHQNTQEKRMAHLGFFEGIHEVAYEPNAALFFSFGVDTNRFDNLKGYLKTGLPTQDPSSFCPMDSKDEFLRAYWSTKNIIIEDFVEEFDWDKSPLLPDLAEVYEHIPFRNSETCVVFTPSEDSREICRTLAVEQKYAFYYHEATNTAIGGFNVSIILSKMGAYSNYQMLIEHGVDLPDHLKAEDGAFFTLETLPGNRVAEYFRDVVYPTLLTVQQS
ncbi:MAG: hypothetical protein HRU43_05300 [Simkaniaceae bacterium]|nr:hypothetical protein [Simkaniaceae bacterium]